MNNPIDFFGTTRRREPVKSHSTFVLSIVASLALGVVTIHALHAQSKPAVYGIVEFEITDPEGFVKEYSPRAVAVIEAAGGKIIVRGGKTISVVGEPPKRVLVVAWQSVEQAQAYRQSAASKELEPVFAKYGKMHRAFFVEGVAPN
jgi:uncharacterized protein (DUF1330 family)